MEPLQSGQPAPENGSPLTIPLDRICFIVSKLREYDTQDLLDEEIDRLSDEMAPPAPEDLDTIEQHENDYRETPIMQELATHIGDLSDDEQIDLVALAWLGRDGHAADEWDDVRAEAAAAHNARTVDYLLGTPLAANFLQEGLSVLGYTCPE